jgi:hypothetical protein
MDAIFGHFVPVAADIDLRHAVGVYFNYIQVVGHGQVNIDAMLVKCMDLGGTDVTEDPHSFFSRDISAPYQNERRFRRPVSAAI